MMTGEEFNKQQTEILTPVPVELHEALTTLTWESSHGSEEFLDHLRNLVDNIAMPVAKLIERVQQTERLDGQAQRLKLAEEWFRKSKLLARLDARWGKWKESGWEVCDNFNNLKKVIEMKSERQWMQDRHEIVVFFNVYGHISFVTDNGHKVDY